MLCERCKIREANIQYTEVINGVKTEHNFCAQCARELDVGQYSAIFDGEFPLVKLLSGLLGWEEPVKKEGKFQQVVCPTCGTTYEEFVENSRFGCGDCYSVFDVLIHDNIKQLQGSDHHNGKKPLMQAGQVQGCGEAESEADSVTAGIMEKDSVKSEIRSWERKLKEALKTEDYETAAVCRDKIRALKEGIETDA